MPGIGAVWALVLGLAVAACSPGYGAANWWSSFGYKNQRLNGDVWRVSYTGNGYTTHETAQTYWLYRCAELSIEQGFDGFEILSDLHLVEQADRPIRLAATHSVPIFIPMYGGYSRADVGYLSGDIRLIKKPFDAAPPKIYDAVELKKTLEVYVTGEKCSMQNVCPHVHSYIYGAGDNQAKAEPAAPADAAPAQRAASMTSEQAEQHLKELDAAAAAPRPAERSAPSSTGDAGVEIAFWNSVKDSNDPELFAAYLQRYPDGNFAAIARIKIEQLATSRRGDGLRQAIVQQPRPAPDGAGTPVRFGDSVAFACPEPGTTIELSDGGTLVFADTRGALCSYATRPGGQLATMSLLGSFDEEAAKLRQLWPLAVGKKLEFAYVAGPNASRNVKLTVTRHESVTVKAGTFDTFVIKARISSSGAPISAFSETVTYWFAPAVGYPVKVTHQLESGVYATGADREAVKVVTSSASGAGASF